MGFGAIITAGESFTVVKDIMLSLTEARVEMTLSKPTLFALRFEEDLCEGDPIVAKDPALQANVMIGIFAPAEGKLQCLVFGPITKIRTASMVGGTGSWVEVHGEDRRVVMNRTSAQAVWTGLASDAAKAILGAYHIPADVETTTKKYTEKQNGLSQRATDLAFLEDIARRNVFEFWLDYEASQPAKDVVTCTYTARMKSSPPAGAAPGPPTLKADANYVINVQPPPEECVKVTKFEAHIDYERPTAAIGFGQQAATGEKTKTPGKYDSQPITPDWKPASKIRKVPHEALTQPETDSEEQALAEKALLNEAAWFVEVDCSTTLEMIGFCVKPHMIIDVKKAGARLSGAYQVKSATHVITATDHFIDFKLRANGLREKEKK